MRDGTTTSKAYRGASRGLILIAFSLAGCHSDPREELLGKVFDALRARSTSSFMKTTITSADYDLKAEGISPFKEHMSYLGRCLKPEEKKRQERRFRRARKGGPGFIDFSQDRFLGIGTRLEDATRETFMGQHLPVSVYSARIRRGGVEVDSKDLYPRFAIVRWGERSFRLIDLVLPEADTSE